MKKILLTLLLLSLGIVAGLAQSQLGMNYQAVIRNDKGEIIANKEVGIQMSILKESTTGESIYTETFTPTTNEFGLINLIIGKGKVVQGTYSAIDWSTANFFLKVELKTEGGTYEKMGESPLLSVPFANYAFNSSSDSWEESETVVSTKKQVGIGTNNPSAMLQVLSDGKTPEGKPLFEVTNSKGETVFAVYEDGVKIFLDEEKEGRKTKGGFAISGRTTTKGEEVDILTVTPSLTEVFVEESTTKTKGGFAISGRTTTKAPVELLNISPSLTQFYVDEPSAKTKGGFAISGRTTTKGEEADILTVTPKLTQVFIEEATAKTKGGFAISGRTTTKGAGTYDVLTVVPERTDIYIKPPTSKNNLPDGFGVHGYISTEPQAGESTELFSISGEGTYVATALAKSPEVKTGNIEEITQTSAMGGGKVIEECCVNPIGITEWGIVYSTGSEIPTIESVSSLTPDKGGMVQEYVSWEFNNLEMQDLTAGTTYKVRAFATNSDGLTGYGQVKEFVTSSGYKITMTVTGDDEDGVNIPLENAKITLWEQYTNTPVADPKIGSEHSFTLSDKAYAYKVEAPGYTEKIEIEYTPTGNETRQIYLDTIPKSLKVIKFIAKDTDNNFVSNVSINIYPTYNLTSSSGEAIFYLSPNNNYPYEVYVPEGYALLGDINGTVTVGEGENTPIELTLEKVYKVTFNIKTANNNPYGDESFTLTKGGESETFVTTPAGTAMSYIPYSKDGVWDYDINAGFDGKKRGKITLANGKDVIENVKLDSIKFYTIKFIFKDNGGNLINDVNVSLTADPDENDYDKTSRSGGNAILGTAVFYNAPANGMREYTYSYNKEGYEPEIDATFSTLYLESEPDDPKTLLINITLTPNALP